MNIPVEQMVGRGIHSQRWSGIFIPDLPFRGDVSAIPAERDGEQPVDICKKGFVPIGIWAHAGYTSDYVASCVCLLKRTYAFSLRLFHPKPSGEVVEVIPSGWLGDNWTISPVPATQSRPRTWI